MFELVFANTVFANEIKMKDINTLSKKNKVIIINKNELSKYLHLKKSKNKDLIKAKTFVKKTTKYNSATKKIDEEKLLKNKIKNKNLIESLILYKKFIVKNQRSKTIDNIILKKARKIKNLDFEFFVKDFLNCNVKTLSNIIKELKHEFK